MHHDMLPLVEWTLAVFLGILMVLVLSVTLGQYIHHKLGHRRR